MIAGAEFYSCSDPEILSDTDPNDAIYEALDGRLDPKMTAAEVQAALPATLTLCGYRRVEVNTRRLHVLERALEDLDEEYGDPDGGPTSPTPAMLAAEVEFLRVLRAEYEPWACEEVGQPVEIDVMDWVRREHPDWLEGKRRRQLSGAHTAGSWNAAHPVGECVRYWPVYPPVESVPPVETRTRSEAWTLGDGSVVVCIDGRAGGVCLSHIEVIAP